MFVLRPWRNFTTRVRGSVYPASETKVRKAVQVIVHCLVSLVVRGAFQGINGICFCVDWKELTPELLFEVSPGLDRKNTGVHLLAKEVLGPPCGTSVFEKGKGPKDFLLIAAELLQSQA